MTTLRTSLICTVYNEEKFIQKLIDSILSQSVLPDEIIFVDGGSTDSTTKIISENVKKYSRLKLFIKKGNRSIGRNEAIRKSKGNVILSTDAGCLLDKKWSENLLTPFQNKSTDVVAGYYKGKARNSFQKALIPYVLVTEDKLNANNFLPATRSMAFRKKIWKEIGGFDETLSHNEDYAFANEIRQKGFNIVFQQNAIAYWIPRNNLLDSFKMFFRFALGDIEAGLIRDKVIYIFLRYLFGLYILILAFIMKSTYLNYFIVFLLACYTIWSIKKNYKYVQEINAFIFLPLLQITSDIAVILGSTLGFIKKFTAKSIIEILKQNKILIFLLIIYSTVVISMINWGIPNSNHPFNYFMDEWHQAQSVRNLFTVGTPNIEGSANGSIFHFFLTGVFLMPFIIFGVINPFAIESAVSNLELQESLFQVLRINTLLFGLLIIIVFYYMCKKFFRVNPLITTFVFIFNPAWLMLSNYYKYDIALMFWTILAFIFMMLYIQRPNFSNLLLASVISSIALSVKLSPFSLPIILIVTFFLFTPKFLQKIKWLLSALIIYLLTFFALGIPDILLGKGNLHEYFFSVLVRTPAFNVSNLTLNNDIWFYLVTNIFPALFGYVLFTTSILYLIYLFISHVARLINNKKRLGIITREQLFILFSFILFVISLIPLKLDASNNRALTLLPFFAIFFGLFWEKLRTIIKSKSLLYVLMIIFIAIQLIQTYSWVKMKISEDPRQASSKWILKNIPKNSTIGVENIPIYQSLPDIVLKEFYAKNTNSKVKKNYNYEIINNLNEFPDYVILTNETVKKAYFNESETNTIRETLVKKSYKRLSSFSPDFKYLRYFTTEIDYYLAAIVQTPGDISIYGKQ